MRNQLILRTPSEWRTAIRGQSFDEVHIYNLGTLDMLERRKVLHAAITAVASKGGQVFQCPGRNPIDVREVNSVLDQLHQEDIHATQD